MRQWSCTVDFNIITSIVSVAENLLIFIWGGVFFPHNPSSLSRFVCKFDGLIWGGGIAVQQHVIWSVYLSPIIYNVQNLHIRKRNLVSCFPEYNLYFHPPIVIISCISIVISINYTGIEPFIPIYESISKVSCYLLPTLFYPAQTSEKCRINITTTMIGR